MYDHHGLTNSNRIVYQEICRLLAEGRPVSYTALADATGYCRQTIANAVRELKAEGYITLQRTETGWKYIVRRDDEIVVGIAKSLLNILTMSSGERWERIMMALAAKRIYDDAQKLKRAARRAGGQLQDRVEAFLAETGADRLSSVWPLDEAAEIRAQIDALSREIR